MYLLLIKCSVDCENFIFVESTCHVCKVAENKKQTVSTSSVDISGCPALSTLRLAAASESKTPIGCSASLFVLEQEKKGNSDTKNVTLF